MQSVGLARWKKGRLPSFDGRHRLVGFHPGQEQERRQQRSTVDRVLKGQDRGRLNARARRERGSDSHARWIRLLFSVDWPPSSCSDSDILPAEM